MTRMEVPRLRMLFDQLNGHRPLDRTEALHRDAMLELCLSPAPFSSAQFDPGHFTASALVISTTVHQVLLIQHPTLGRWLQPGGHIDPDDATVLAAAIREVREETGFQPEFDSPLADVDVHRIPARGHRAAHDHYDVRFVGRVAGTPPIAGAEGIVGEWFELAEAVQRASDSGLVRLLTKAAQGGLLR